MTSLLAAMVAEMTIITFRTYKQGWTKQYPISLPLPADYLATLMAYGVLLMVNEVKSIRPIPNLIGWGFVLATGLNLFDPTTIGAKGGTQVKKGNAPSQLASSLFAKPNTNGGTGK